MSTLFEGDTRARSDERRGHDTRTGPAQTGAGASLAELRATARSREATRGALPPDGLPRTRRARTPRRARADLRGRLVAPEAREGAAMTTRAAVTSPR